MYHWSAARILIGLGRRLRGRVCVISTARAAEKDSELDQLVNRVRALLTVEVMVLLLL